jgi:DNA-binding SARP family transcriptional activator
LWCDVHAFGAAYREGRLQEAMNLANEAFLTGFYVPDGGQFMAWVDDRRRTLKEMAIDAARRLAREADTASNPHQAVGWWLRSLELSPYDEEILISLIWALVRTGNHGRAREAYRQFRERISRDLEMEPSPRTQAAVQRALTSSGSAVGNPEEPSVSRRTRWRTGTSGSYLDQ